MAGEPRDTDVKKASKNQTDCNYQDYGQCLHMLQPQYMLPGQVNWNYGSFRFRCTEPKYYWRGVCGGGGHHA